MPKCWPVLLILAGLGMVFGGFGFDVLFAGVPYQDPTPEMTAGYERNGMIGSGVSWTGVVVMMSGCSAGFCRMARSGRRKRSGG
ncbi:MAG: hypothetical protein O3A92_14080 [Verrucomicrobia bacterium]|nr:hypothetical protein [Verrucomicrobiota bacterium]